MNCYEIVQKCTNIICSVKWQVTTLNQRTYDMCSRHSGRAESDKMCVTHPLYTGRTRYDVNGVVQVDDVRRNESGTYTCNCVCPIGHGPEESKSYYGVIIVREL